MNHPFPQKSSNQLGLNIIDKSQCPGFVDFAEESHKRQDRIVSQVYHSNTQVSINSGPAMSPDFIDEPQ